MNIMTPQQAADNERSSRLSGIQRLFRAITGCPVQRYSDDFGSNLL
jgi:hypothetical protein